MSFARRDSGGPAGDDGGGGGPAAGKRTLTQRVQPRLRVGASGDVREQGADAVASRVVDALHGGGAPPTAPIAIAPLGAGAEVQGKDAGTVGNAPDSVVAATGAGGGAALDDITGARMGTAFGGHDFSGVRVHTGGDAARSAADIGAEAYTVGQDVFFGGGAYQPGTPSGDGLIAHELAHTVQQGDGGGVAHRRLVQRQDRTDGNTGGGTEQTDQVDAEGNHYRTAGGKTYLTAAPVTPVPLHSGKHEALPANPLNTFNSMMAQVDTAQADQLAAANTLKGGVNPPADYKYWFAKVYYFVTQHEKAAIRAGTYQYPLMKAQEVIWFQNAYRANLDAWNSGVRTTCEPHWRAAFAAAEAGASTDVASTTARLGTAAGGIGGVGGGALAGAAIGTWVFPVIGTGLGALGGAVVGGIAGLFAGGPAANAMTEASRRVLSALLPSMQAHIRFDLPRAIAGCFTSYYAGVPNLAIADFQADFDAMGPVFDAAQASLNPEISAACGGWDPGTWSIAQAAFPAYFDVAQERRTTWTKAVELVAAQQAGATSAQAEDRMRTATGSGSPVTGSDNFEVDQNPVSGFDWMNNPGTAPPQTVAPTTGSN